MENNQPKISVDEYIQYLKDNGLELIRTKGTHQVWARKDLARSVVFNAGLNGYVAQQQVKMGERAIGAAMLKS
jgi:predicted RNA binding protein YcfA (HicA-like mRNA interferase family)